jgi:hypothetical protein
MALGEKFEKSGRNFTAKGPKAKKELLQPFTFTSRGSDALIMWFNEQADCRAGPMSFFEMTVCLLGHCLA